MVAMGTIGPWGWHLPNHLKWSLTAASASYVYFEWTDEEWNRDDFFASGQFLLTVYSLWVPPPAKAAITFQVGMAIGRIAAPAAPLILGTAAALVVGDLIADQIDPKEGRKNFRKFVFGGPKVWYKESKDVTLPALQGLAVEHVLQPLAKKKLEVERTITILGNVVWLAAERELRRQNPFYRFGVYGIGLL